MLPLKSVIYVSRAAPDLPDGDVFAIYKAAREFNALNGITGLLIFDGAAFAQIVEGTEEALLDLFVRLGRDLRHGDLNIVDDREIVERSFGDWSMKLLRIDRGHMSGIQSLDALMSQHVRPDIRAKMLEVISRMDELAQSTGQV